MADSTLPRVKIAIRKISALLRARCESSSVISGAPTITPTA